MNSFNVLIIDDDKDINEILEISFDDFNTKLHEKDKSKIKILKCFQGRDGVNVVEDHYKKNINIDKIDNEKNSALIYCCKNKIMEDTSF